MNKSPRLRLSTVYSFSIFSPLSELIICRGPCNAVTVLMANAGNGALHGHVYGIIPVWIGVSVLHGIIIRIILTCRNAGLDLPCLQNTIIVQERAREGWRRDSNMPTQLKQGVGEVVCNILSSNSSTGMRRCRHLKQSKEIRNQELAPDKGNKRIKTK